MDKPNWANYLVSQMNVPLIKTFSESLHKLDKMDDVAIFFDDVSETYYIQEEKGGVYPVLPLHKNISTEKAVYQFIDDYNAWYKSQGGSVVKRNLVNMLIDS